MFLVMGASTLLAQPATESVKLPHGFVTYSRGEAYERVLCRAEVAPGMTFEDIHATERPIVEKGPYGGDITSQISFDGKWVAFARSLKGTDDGSGGNNYADFGKWDIYIARVDGPLPATPIRIAHGFFPSWGSDSAEGSEKTLYFAVHEARAVHCVRINDKGEIVEAEREVGSVPAEGYEGFIFAAPNGQFCAYRKSGAVYTHWFEGPNKGKSILMTGGCHPHVTADSRWVYHANRNAVRADGSARGEAGAGGLYHYGSSNDLNWFVTRTEGDNTIINKGRESWLCTLYATETRFDTEKAVKLSDQAGFIDIHVYPDKASRKAARSNRRLHEQQWGGTAIPKAQKQYYKGPSAELLKGLPVSEGGETFRWERDGADNRITDRRGQFLRSSRLIPEGRAFLGQGGRMHIDGGHFRTTDGETAAAVCQAARQTSQFTMEMQFVCHDMDASGPARIASCSKDWSRRNWTVGQEKDKLVLRFRTLQNGENGTNHEINLGKIERDKPYHLIFSYVPGLLTWQLNGQKGMTTSVKDRMDNWEPYDLIFGDEFSGERQWRGDIAGVRIYAYAMDNKAMDKRYKAARKTLDALSPEVPIEVDAVVLENSVDPSPRQLKEQGYSRCLTTRHMRVTASRHSRLPVGAEFILKEWTVLGLETLNSRKEGDRASLRLYEAAKHPELQNEYTVEGLSVFDLPVYYSASVGTR